MNVSALLVGINNYPSSPLRGCLNDVMIMRDILIQKYRVPAHQIRMLLNERATKNEILTRMEWLKNTNTDMKLFWYSGHGAQVPNQSYNTDYEIDGLDEIICPYDFNWDGNWISDDIFSQFFSQVKGRIISVFDSCHSGTMEKEIPYGHQIAGNSRPYIKDKSIIAPPDILSRDKDFGLSSLIGQGLDYLFDIDININIDNSTHIYNSKISKKLINEPNDNLIMISGSQENQTSADAYINGRFQGALSYFIQKNLMKDIDISYHQLYENVCNDLKSHYTQIPQMVCSNPNMSFLR
jgi:hypothetical protein